MRPVSSQGDRLTVAQCKTKWTRLLEGLGGSQHDTVAWLLEQEARHLHAVLDIKPDYDNLPPGIEVVEVEMRPRAERDE